MADATSDPEVKEQWQSASDNALKAAEKLNPRAIHNSAIDVKMSLNKINTEDLGLSGKEAEQVQSLLDMNKHLMDMLINKPIKPKN